MPIYGINWRDTEPEALRWIADLAGMPDGAGGTFVQGGSAGNLSALVDAQPMQMWVMSNG